METPTTNRLQLQELVSNVRNYVVDRRFMLDLDELVTEEADTLIKEIASIDPGFEGDWDPTKFTSRVEFCEQTTKRLAVTLGIMGRWCDGYEVNDVANIVLYIHRALREMNRSSALWTDLRIYPVVLLVAVYGLALTRSKRWAAIHDLLNVRIDNGSPDHLRIADELSVSSWHSIDRRAWQWLEGLDNHRTPFSERVCKVTQDWSVNSIGVVADFEELFDMWDILASLVYSERLDEDHEREITPVEGSVNWVPLGRVSWRVHSRLKILHSFRNEISDSLLTAGFFSGDRKKLFNAIDNVSAAADRRMWY